MIIYLIVVALISCVESNLTFEMPLPSPKCSDIGVCQNDSHKCIGSYTNHSCDGQNFRCCSKTPIVYDISECSNNLKIISRDSWGARRPKERKTIGKKLQRLFIHHGALDPCMDRVKCMGEIRRYQNLHLDNRMVKTFEKYGGNFELHNKIKCKPETIKEIPTVLEDWSDIGYNFLVGEDGYLYEGRGWQIQGSHTKYYNSESIGLCFIGKFAETKPNNASLNTAKRFIECAKDLGYLSANYSLYGHRDVKCKDCPGEMLYNEIKTWDNFHRFASENVMCYCENRPIKYIKIGTRCCY